MYDKIDCHKFFVSFWLWLITFGLGLIPVFVKFVDWFLDEDENKLDFIYCMVLSTDYYSCVISILIVSMIELVLQTGNKYGVLIILNVIVDSIILLVYNLALFKMDFLNKVFIGHTKGTVAFVIALSVTMFVISVLNIWYLSKKEFDLSLNYAQTKNKNVKLRVY